VAIQYLVACSKRLVNSLTNSAGETLGVAGDFVEVEEVSEIDVAVPSVVCHVGFDGIKALLVLIGHLAVWQN
jgi:hypothetical protein